MLCTREFGRRSLLTCLRSNFEQCGSLRSCGNVRNMTIHPTLPPGKLDKEAAWRVTERNPLSERDDVPTPAAVQMYREAENAGVEYFHNRNPRNAELLGYQDRTLGWSEDEQRVCSDYYHRIVLERSNKHTTAWLEHFESGVLMSVSTAEPWIRSRLHKTYDRNAALNVGRVLAHRMKSMGLNCAKFWDPSLSQFYSAKTEAFMCGVKMEGVKLEEAKVDSLHWGVAEDGDTAQHYHGDSDKLLEYLRNKAQQRAELFE